jgi:hypothetical protein
MKPPQMLLTMLQVTIVELLWLLMPLLTIWPPILFMEFFLHMLLTIRLLIIPKLYLPMSNRHA